MMDIRKILDAPGMAPFFSFMLGIAIAAMFRPVCRGPECVVLRGPPVQDIRDAVYQFGSRCVEFKTKAVECPKGGSGNGSGNGSTVSVVDTVSFADYEAK